MDPEFLQLDDAGKWHLIGIWIVASDRNGIISDDPVVVQKQIGSDTKPDLERFLSLQLLEKTGKRRRQKDVTLTSNGYQMVAPEAEADTEAEKESAEPPIAASAPVAIPLKDGTEYPIDEPQIDEWKSVYPGVDILQELRKCREWGLSNPAKRKTRRGARKHITTWLNSAHVNGTGAKSGPTWPEGYEL